MKAPLFAALLLVATLGRAQAQEKQTRPVGAFTAIEANGGIEVVLQPGPTAAVVVEAEAAVQPQLLTTVRNGRLLIRWASNPAHAHRTARVRITCPAALSAFELGGGSTAHTTAALSVETLALTVGGGSTATLALHAQRLTSTASSGSTIHLQGQAEQEQVSVSSGSSYHAFGLKSRAVQVTASSGSTAEVAASGELSAVASSGSAVRYQGAPQLRKSQASSGASISRAN